MKLKRPSKYIENLKSCCFLPQVQQSIFLSNAAVAEGPDTYIDSVSSVSAQFAEERQEIL